MPSRPQTGTIRGSISDPSFIDAPPIPKVSFEEVEIRAAHKQRHGENWFGGTFPGLKRDGLNQKSTSITTKQSLVWTTSIAGLYRAISKPDAFLSIVGAIVVPILIVFGVNLIPIEPLQESNMSGQLFETYKIYFFFYVPTLALLLGSTLTSWTFYIMKGKMNTMMAITSIFVFGIVETVSYLGLASLKFPIPIGPYLAVILPFLVWSVMIYFAFPDYVRKDTGFGKRYSMGLNSF